MVAGGEFHKKVVCITGAGRGIGAALALGFARAGADLFLMSRGQGPLEEVARRAGALGGRVETLTGDVGDPETVQRAVDRLGEVWGGLDVCIHNAGILGPRVPLAEYPLEDWQEVMRVNLTGTFLMAQGMLPLLRRKQGSMILLTSTVGRKGRANWGAYAVSKAGVESITQILADEERASGVRVNAVNPGKTRTAMRAAAYPEEDPQTLPPPEHVVPICQYLASERSRPLTGHSLDAKDFDPTTGVLSVVDR